MLRLYRTAMTTQRETTIDHEETAASDFLLWALLSQASHMIHRVRARELRQDGISVMEFRVLITVKVIGCDTPGKIAQWLGRTPHATSSLLTRMEKTGLVERVKNPDAKTSVRIVITEKGQQVLSKTRGIESIRRIMSALPPANQSRLEADLETLRETALRELALSWRPPFPKAP